jgi:hypothetical protein
MVSASLRASRDFSESLSVESVRWVDVVIAMLRSSKALVRLVARSGCRASHARMPLIASFAASARTGLVNHACVSSVAAGACRQPGPRLRRRLPNRPERGGRPRHPCGPGCSPHGRQASGSPLSHTRWRNHLRIRLCWELMPVGWGGVAAGEPSVTFSMPSISPRTSDLNVSRRTRQYVDRLSVRLGRATGPVREEADEGPGLSTSSGH